MHEEMTYHLGDFDGPLDLLLHLIRVNEMDILDIPIVAITQQYLDFLHQAEERNLDIAGEFLVMAATLMGIKSTYLIPKNEPQEDEALADYVEEADPREQLMQQLLEYQQYQEVASTLRQREEERKLQFSRSPMPMPEDVEHVPLPAGLELADLQAAFDRMVKRRQFKQAQPRTMAAESWSIQTQMDQLMAQLATTGELRFEACFSPMAPKAEIVTTFLGMLELVRHQFMLAVQETDFGEIILTNGPKVYVPGSEVELGESLT